MPLDNRLGACYIKCIMEDKMTTKTCSKCGEEKPATTEYFHKHGKYLRSVCKICVAEYHKQYYQANRETRAEQIKQYNQANKEAIAEWRKQYRQANLEANREAKAEYDKQYRQANREVLIEQRKQYYQANREAIIERSKQYRQANREAIAEWSKQYRQAKNAEQPACIYQIVNSQNGRIYVGETMRGVLRWKYSHLSYLRCGNHSNSDLQTDFNKFGEEAFEWSIIKELPKDKEVLTKEEKLHIDSLIAEGKSLYNERFVS